jgi:hypothetical protein
MSKVMGFMLWAYMVLMATLLATAALFGMVWVWAKAFWLMLSVFGVTA